jgi:hypothetical protein
MDLTVGSWVGTHFELELSRAWWVPWPSTVLYHVNNGPKEMYHFIHNQINQNFILDMIVLEI